MAQLNSLMLPDGKNSIGIAQIVRVTAFDNGVGIFNHRNIMIGWIPTANEEHLVRVVGIIDEIINNPRQAKKPDWSFLDIAAS